MPKKRKSYCFAPGCKTGYAGLENSPRLSLFGAPADEEGRSLWEKNLRRADKSLDKFDAVCELHFEERFILRDYVHIIGGKEVRLPRGKPSLAPGAVPTILPNLPTHLTERKPCERTGRKRKGEVHKPNRGKRIRPAEHDADNFTSRSDLGIKRFDLFHLQKPTQYWVMHQFPNFDGVVYASAKFNSETVSVTTEKTVLLSRDTCGAKVMCRAYVREKLVDERLVETAEDAEELLRKVDAFFLCKGAMEATNFSAGDLTTHFQSLINNRSGTLFSRKCAGKVTKEGVMCLSCKYLQKALLARKCRVKPNS